MNKRYENLEQLRCIKAALALSEARFRNMIEKDADGIIIVGSNGVMCFANAAAEVLFSCTAEEFLGQLFGFPVVAGEIMREANKTKTPTRKHSPISDELGQ